MEISSKIIQILRKQNRTTQLACVMSLGHLAVKVETSICPWPEVTFGISDFFCFRISNLNAQIPTTNLQFIYGFVDQKSISKSNLQKPQKVKSKRVERPLLSRKCITTSSALYTLTEYATQCFQMDIFSLKNLLLGPF